MPHLIKIANYIILYLFIYIYLFSYNIIFIFLNEQLKNLVYEQ